MHVAVRVLHSSAFIVPAIYIFEFGHQIILDHGVVHVVYQARPLFRLTTIITHSIHMQCMGKGCRAKKGLA